MHLKRWTQKPAQAQRSPHRCRANNLRNHRRLRRLRQFFQRQEPQVSLRSKTPTPVNEFLQKQLLLTHKYCEIMWSKGRVGLSFRNDLISSRSVPAPAKDIVTDKKRRWWEGEGRWLMIVVIVMIEMISMNTMLMTMTDKSLVTREKRGWHQNQVLPHRVLHYL